MTKFGQQIMPPKPAPRQGVPLTEAELGVLMRKDAEKMAKPSSQVKNGTKHADAKPGRVAANSIAGRAVALLHERGPLMSSVIARELGTTTKNMTNAMRHWEGRLFVVVGKDREAKEKWQNVWGLIE